MITINITILIQIVNFVVAYVIIRTLLLKPAVAIILQEEEHRANLDKSIESIANTNKGKEETMAHHWATCRQEFGERAPEIAETEQALRARGIVELPAVPELDKKAIEPMADNLAEELVERISHVR